ncbi:MAG: hypothetical protein KAR19_14560 [Bacteroidales bacterium]|nr:hypothetical protein [Bacteroidales bacterium]
MKSITLILVLFLLTGCADDDLSWISIRNETEVSIYAQSYSSGFTNGDWILPGLADEFYSISCDCLDGYAYFSFYYDSLIIYMKDHEEDPIKFYQDGSTENYDPTLNPFTNPDVWKKREFERHLSGSSFNTPGEKHIFEHYFCIDAESVKSLADTILHELNPAP